MSQVEGSCYLNDSSLTIFDVGIDGLLWVFEMLRDAIRLYSTYNDRVVCIWCCPEVIASLDSLRIRIATLVADLLKSLVDD